MNPRTKIKVRREDLLAAVKQRQSDEKAAYAKALAKYNDAKHPHMIATADWLEAMADKVRRGGKLPSGYDLCNQQPKIKAKYPSQPRDLTSTIAQLSMSVDEVIAVSVEDFSQYIGR